MLGADFGFHFRGVGVELAIGQFVHRLFHSLVMDGQGLDGLRVDEGEDGCLKGAAQLCCEAGSGAPVVVRARKG